MASIRLSAGQKPSRIPRLASWSNDIKLNRYAYIMAIPVIAYYFIFHYMPMYGLIIAFKDFAPAVGIWGSDWVGLQHFIDFFSSDYCLRVIRNTILISLYTLLFSFPAPIILALMINEVRNRAFKRVIQTTTYLPHFISTVVVCGMITDFSTRDGLFNQLISLLGGEPIGFLSDPAYFRIIYVASEVWQTAGWNTILYLAALTAIDAELYDAADIDGANWWHKTCKITLPGILPTISVLLIMKLGQMMNVGYEKIILLYNPLTYDTADVISSFVYRRGLQESNYSYATAVGLFNSVINFALVIGANRLSRKLNDTGLW